MTKVTQRQMIINALEAAQPMATFQISEATGMSQQKLSVVMSRMELDGLIERLPERVKMQRDGFREWSYVMYVIKKKRPVKDRLADTKGSVFGSMVAQCL